MPPRKATAPKQVKSTTHADKRTNIPTEELRDFVADDERNPIPVTYERPLLYPRDPDADPQLVWRGKDEQDTGPLTVPAVPLYIQEKIDPRALVEDLRRHTLPSEQREQLLLFEDFDGLEGFEQVEFYEHAANWSNRMILGDALLVMNSLAEKESLLGQVQMIYMDPPYGIKFASNWQVSTRKREVKDGSDASRQPEQVKAFRDTWREGIHSYLTYLRDRLIIARDLLTDSGSLFVQIGEENVHLVRNLLDEVFGPQCSVVTIAVKKKGSQRSGYMDPVNDYLLWYSKTPRNASGGGPKFRPVFVSRPYDADSLRTFNRVQIAHGSDWPLSGVPDQDGTLVDYRPRPQQLFRDHPGSRLYAADPLTSGGVRTNQSLPFSWDGNTFDPKSGNSWKHTARAPEGDICGMERLGIAGRLIAADTTWRYRRYFDDFPFVALDNWWDNLGGAGDPVYVVQTNTEIVKRCMLMTTDPGDLVLDPTCGSGTTAFVAEQWARRWITIDTSRVAMALARTRLMAARYPYYLLEDSPDGAAKERTLTGKANDGGTFGYDVRHGFVYRRQPHTSSSVIANCSAIRPGVTKDAIDKAILQEAPVELLVDQPYDDSKKVRVSGRFTVESLSPHRNLTSESSQDSEDNVSFVSTIIEHLQTSGVQNTFRNERLSFETLEPYVGDGLLHAHGTTMDAAGNSRTVAVMIGPEHGTVSPDMVKDAAREALKGAGFDILVVCGFAFEAYASETAKEFAPSGDGFVAAEDERKMGRLRVLLTHMNPDLAMSNELLKKTGSGNLFTVFGEPDVTITSTEGEIVVEVHGVDVYDPTTGVVRPSSTDDIACWFIDTDYDGEQFFVRHAYFTGADKPYEKLQRSLNADIDEAAWASLYSTKSRSFAPPSTGRIAVKVINHYGDEVLQVYEVAT